MRFRVLYLTLFVIIFLTIMMGCVKKGPVVASIGRKGEISLEELKEDYARQRSAEALKTAKILTGKSFLGLKLTKEALNANIDAPSLENAIKLENYIQNVCGNVGESEKNISSEFLKRS